MLQYSLVSSMPPTQPIGARLEVAIIDTSLGSWPVLRDALAEEMEVVLLDSMADGLDAMAAALSLRSGITGLHLLSHGFAGGICLGTAILDRKTLRSRSRQLSAIRHALAPGADLLIYGCNVASGHGGGFLEMLAGTMKANIRASRTPTGALEQGGDWALDWSCGQPRTAARRVDGYPSLMATGPSRYVRKPNL